MTEVDVSLLIGAVLVGLVSWRYDRRGIMWICVAALSYINATIAWRLHLPYAEAITAAGDVAICLAVYFAGREMWEMLIWRLFQTSVAISLLYLAGNLGVFLSIPHEFYSVLMETINWLLLLFIGGMSIARYIGAKNVLAHQPWRNIHLALHSLRQKRAHGPFTSRAR